MSLLLIPVGLRCRRFPRVSGDEPKAAVIFRDGDQFSPRERG